MKITLNVFLSQIVQGLTVCVSSGGSIVVMSSWEHVKTISKKRYYLSVPVVTFTLCGTSIILDAESFPPALESLFIYKQVLIASVLPVSGSFDFLCRANVCQ